MKKNYCKFVSMLLVAVCLCANFTACSDDDDEKVKDGTEQSEEKGGGDDGTKQNDAGSVSGIENGYAYVDLGLPSGLKWATCNVGAENPWDYGDYFAWGETTPKSDYNWSTYLDGNIASDLDCGTDKDALKGVTDIAATQYDAAKTNMGGLWRMPNYSEQQELIYNCCWKHTYNYKGTGVAGYIVYRVKYSFDKGNVDRATMGSYSLNDTHIFLPAAGYHSEWGLTSAGGAYWSSSLYSTHSYGAYILFFVGWNGYDYRCNGLSVRGVVE